MEEQSNRKPKGKLWKILLAVLLALLVLAGTAWFVLFRVNQFYLEIRLHGEREITLEYGDIYEDPGAEVFFCGTLLLKEGYLLENIMPEVSTDLQQEVLGRYTVRYHASYEFWEADEERLVFVLDTECPVIELVPGSEETILPGTIYEEPGFKATDNYDGDLTDKVIRKEDMGVITYAVIDSSGNPAYAQREIPYHDPVPPELDLVGEEKMTITVGTFYTEPGYAASDNVDGNMTDLVQIEGEVDWLNPGVYELKYTVTDGYENTVTKTRAVEVVAKERPEVKWPTEKTIYLTFDDGPGPYTKALLDVLDRYGAKATFFVVDSGYYSSMREIVRRGHSIGIHSVTHDYEEIYASPEAFFTDLYNMQDLIEYHTGVKTTLMRFPGGSSNVISRHSSEGIMTLLTEKVQDAGFQYFDWHVDSNDAGGAKRAETVRDNVIEGCRQRRTSVVLQHDIHAYSVDAVEEILQWGKKNGYKFRALRDTSPGAHHDVNN